MNQQAAIIYSGYFHGEYRELPRNKRTGRSRCRMSGAYYLKNNLNDTKISHFFSVDASNRNEAQYLALIELLMRAENEQAFPLNVYGDSQLVIRQMSRTYKVNSARIMPLYARSKKLSTGRNIGFFWIPSKFNRYVVCLSQRIQPRVVL